MNKNLHSFKIIKKSNLFRQRSVCIYSMNTEARECIFNNTIGNLKSKINIKKQGRFFVILNIHNLGNKNTLSKFDFIDDNLLMNGP